MVRPHLVLIVRAAINQAQERAEKDKDAAQALLDIAPDEFHGGLFPKLKDKLASLTRRQSDRQVSSNQQQQLPKAA